LSFLVSDEVSLLCKTNTLRWSGIS